MTLGVNTRLRATAVGVSLMLLVLAFLYPWITNIFFIIPTKAEAERVADVVVTWQTRRGQETGRYAFFTPSSDDYADIMAALDLAGDHGMAVHAFPNGSDDLVVRVLPTAEAVANGSRPPFLLDAMEAQRDRPSLKTWRVQPPLRSLMFGLVPPGWVGQ